MILGLRSSRRNLLLGSSATMALVAVLTFALLSTSSGGVLEGGPLGPPTNRTTSCLPLTAGHLLTDGFDVLRDQGHKPIMIERLSLRSPRRLRLVGSYLVPLARTDSDAVGFWANFPPPARQVSQLRGVKWARRENPHGTRIIPGHMVNAVLGIGLTGHRTGSAAGLDVQYESGGRQYDFVTHSRVVLKPSPQRCS
jgi:hypothetical protein